MDKRRAASLLVAAVLFAVLGAVPHSAHAAGAGSIVVADDADQGDAGTGTDATGDGTDTGDNGAATDNGDAFSQGESVKSGDDAAADSSNAAAAKPVTDFESAIAAFNGDDTDQKIKAVQLLGDEPRAVPVLLALANDGLFTTAKGRVVYADGAIYRDAATGKEVSGLKSDALSEVVVNNRLRGVIQGVVGQLRLFAPDAATRRKAVAEISAQPTPKGEDMMRKALAKETDPDTKAVMVNALARFDLVDPDPAKRLEAIDELADSNDPNVRGMLQQMVGGEKDPKVKAAAEKAISSIAFRLGVINIGVSLFEGLSLGSILLLAAIGLSITFGVMGVINMAHGEMIMLGAYTAYVVQQLFHAWLPPGWLDGYLVAALPIAFLVTALVGIALERSVIRFLYGRPLETLLATWGISLALQQAVRSIFGPDNQAVANPSWMTGGMALGGGFTLTWNRLVIIFFCLAVLGALAAVLRYSSFGLHMRAVSQNRSMASAMGIRTGRVDAMTFAVGSGIAGIAGVALSQVGNVSPNLGQIYIVDSFMVVVFGGVGSLWGTLLGAGSLGIVNKLLEPFAGAILGKILVLVFIILFIQRRPRGLFALKGRAAEN
jgi:urea transport system permease protein